MVLGVRERRREETRREILEAAWDLARTKGLAGISLRDVAAAVGMQAPSLYSYFPSKNAIYDAMFAEGYTALTELADAHPEAGLREMAHRFVEFCVADPARYQLLFQRTVPGFVPSTESYAIAQRVLERSAERLAQAGFGTQEDLDLWTALMTGLTDQQISNDPGGKRWLRLVDEAVDMYVARKPSRKKRR